MTRAGERFGLAALLPLLLVILTSGWPAIALSQTPEPKCFVNGGTTYPGCVPAKMVFRIDSAGETRVFDSLGAGIMAALERRKATCPNYGQYCKGIYRSHVSYTGRNSSGKCEPFTTYGSFPSLSRSGEHRYSVSYRFDVYWEKNPGTITCLEGSQMVPASLFGTTGSNQVWGVPVCPANHKKILEFPDQWAGSFGYYCAPDLGVDYYTQKPTTSPIRSTCTDGPRPTCGLAGNPVDISNGNRKVENKTDLVVAGDFPIAWQRTYLSDPKFMGAHDWQFPALKRLDWSEDQATSALWVSLQRGDGSRIVFRGSGPLGNRSWAPFWGGTSPSFQHTIRSKLSDWIVNGQPNGFVLLNDLGEEEFYGMDGKLEAVKNAQGLRHFYHYNSSGLLGEIEQEGGRSLYLTWASMADPENSSTLTYEEQDSGNTGEGTPQTSTYGWYSNLGSRTDLLYHPVLASVSDGNRTVNYEWGQPFSNQYTYSPKLSSVVLADGRTWTYRHSPDQAGFISGVLDPEGKQVASYSYTGSQGAVYEQWKGPADIPLKIDHLRYSSQWVRDGLSNLFSFTSTGGKMNTYSTDCPACFGMKAKSFEYEADYQTLKRTTDFNNVRTDYTHDPEGRLASTTQAVGTPLARTRTYTWLPGYNLPLTETEPVLVNGTPGTRTTSWTYDSQRRPTSRTVSVPDGAGGLAQRTWTYEYDTSGRLWKAAEPGGRLTELLYNSYGDVVARIEDPSTTAERITRWGGHRAGGLPRWSLDPHGIATLLEWDAAGRLLESRAAVLASVPSDPLLGATSWTPTLPTSGTRATAYTYNEVGLLARTDHVDGTYTTLSYDAVNRLVGTSLFGVDDSLVSTVELTLDVMSNVTGTTLKDAQGQVVRAEGAVYDSQYRVAQALNAAQQAVWSQTFDAMHRPTSNTDVLGRTNAQQYDALGRMLTHTDALNQVSTLTYGPGDEVRTATDTRGVQTTYAYNGFGEILEIASPDRGTWVFSYDTAGRRTSMTDPRGGLANYSHDALGRVVSTVYSDDGASGSQNGFLAGDVAHSFDYDSCTSGVGRLCSVTDPTGTTAYSYNAWGEVVGKAWTGKAGGVGAGITLSTGYGYDEETGQLQTVSMPSGKVLAVSYGPDGRPSALDYGVDRVVANVQWTAFDAVKSWVWPMSVGWSGIHSTVSFDYDLDGRPVAIEDLDERELVWDPASRLIAVDDANDVAKTQLYGYDPLDRLTSADIGAWMAPQTYGYDAVGNRTSHTDDATGNGWEYAYGLSHNRMTSRWSMGAGTPGTAYASSYDAMGNLVSDGMGLSLAYDATGRLVQGSKGLATQTSGYNALGQRVSRTVVGGTQAGSQLYAYDEQGRPLGVYTPDASEPTGFRVVEEYVHLDGWRPVAVVRPNATSGMVNPDIHPILTDHLGTPRKVLDASTGQPRWEWDAKEPFGHQAPNQTPTAGLPAFVLDLRFPGQRYDEVTGLFQNGFRDYHAGLGRYVQSDPLGLEAGWNTYGYATGNPMSFTDPYGLDAIQTVFDYFQPPALPQGLVDYSAGWGDRLSTVPFTDYSLTKRARQALGTDGMVNCYSSSYSAGQVTGMAHGAALSIWAGGGGFVVAGQRGVPSGMARVTTWGSQSIGPGSWVVMGGPNKVNWALSGVSRRFKFSNSSTHVVPRSSLGNPYRYRPANEPAGIAWGKNFLGINSVQKIYKP